MVTCCALLVCSNEPSIGRTDVAVMCGESAAARDGVPLDNDVVENSVAYLELGRGS